MNKNYEAECIVCQVKVPIGQKTAGAKYRGCWYYLCDTHTKAVSNTFYNIKQIIELIWLFQHEDKEGDDLFDCNDYEILQKLGLCQPEGSV